jgi:hypothetical protein
MLPKTKIFIFFSLALHFNFGGNMIVIKMLGLKN